MWPVSVAYVAPLLPYWLTDVLAAGHELRAGAGAVGSVGAVVAAGRLLSAGVLLAVDALILWQVGHSLVAIISH